MSVNVQSCTRAVQYSKQKKKQHTHTQKQEKNCSLETFKAVRFLLGKEGNTTVFTNLSTIFKAQCVLVYLGQLQLAYNILSIRSLI